MVTSAICIARAAFDTCRVALAVSNPAICAKAKVGVTKSGQDEVLSAWAKVGHPLCHNVRSIQGGARALKHSDKARYVAEIPSRAIAPIYGVQKFKRSETSKTAPLRASTEASDRLAVSSVKNCALPPLMHSP